MAEPKALESSLNKLTINPEPSRFSRSSKQKQPVAECWEDEELEGGANEENSDNQPLSPRLPVDYPSAPPPTPISPSTSFAHDTFIHPYGYTVDGASSVRNARASPRPEKTDAVAKRMIAGALGVKAPKKTDEQKAYERAIKEKEMKRRNLEKEAAAKAKEEAERQKAAIWND